jgi:hypothetical protein
VESAVHLPEHDIQGADDGDSICEHVTPAQFIEGGQVREAGRGCPNFCV